MGTEASSSLRIKWGEVVQGQTGMEAGRGQQGSERRGMRDLRVEVVTVSRVMGI